MISGTNLELCERLNPYDYHMQQHHFVPRQCATDQEVEALESDDTSISCSSCSCSQPSCTDAIKKLSEESLSDGSTSNASSLCHWLPSPRSNELRCLWEINLLGKSPTSPPCAMLRVSKKSSHGRIRKNLLSSQKYLQKEISNQKICRNDSHFSRSNNEIENIRRWKSDSSNFVKKRFEKGKETCQKNSFIESSRKRRWHDSCRVSQLKIDEPSTTTSQSNPKQKKISNKKRTESADEFQNLSTAISLESSRRRRSLLSVYSLSSKSRLRITPKFDGLDSKLEYISKSQSCILQLSGSQSRHSFPHSPRFNAISPLSAFVSPESASNEKCMHQVGSKSLLEKSPSMCPMEKVISSPDKSSSGLVAKAFLPIKKRAASLMSKIVCSKPYLKPPSIFSSHSSHELRQPPTDRSRSKGRSFGISEKLTGETFVKQHREPVDRFQNDLDNKSIKTQINHLTSWKDIRPNSCIVNGSPVTSNEIRKAQRIPDKQTTVVKSCLGKNFNVDSCVLGACGHEEFGSSKFLASPFGVNKSCQKVTERKIQNAGMLQNKRAEVTRSQKQEFPSPKDSVGLADDDQAHMQQGSKSGATDRVSMRLASLNKHQSKTSRKRSSSRQQASKKVHSSTHSRRRSQEELYILKQLARLNMPVESDGTNSPNKVPQGQFHRVRHQRRRTLYDPRTRNLLRAGVRESSDQRETQLKRVKMSSPKFLREIRSCIISNSENLTPAARKSALREENENLQKSRALNFRHLTISPCHEKHNTSFNSPNTQRPKRKYHDQPTDEALFHKIRKLKEHGWRAAKKKPIDTYVQFDKGNECGYFPVELLLSAPYTSRRRPSLQLRALVSPRRGNHRILRSSLKFSKHIRRPDQQGHLSMSQFAYALTPNEIHQVSESLLVSPLGGPSIIQEQNSAVTLECDSPFTVPADKIGLEDAVIFPLRIVLPTRKLDADFSSFGYKHVDILSHGPTARTHIVRSAHDGELWVAKVIDLAHLTLEEVSLARLEAEYLQRLRHPFILRFKESFGTHSSLVIITEYCEGGDLFGRLTNNSESPMQRLIAARQRQRNSPDLRVNRSLSGRNQTDHGVNPLFGIAPNLIVKWITQLALGLQYMHSQKILHCDLKSSNIFLTADGTAKIGDLGIAREMGHHSRTRGTPIYMSPEICRGSEVTDKADSWALGCVLYELVFQKHAIDDVKGNDTAHTSSTMGKVSEGIEKKLPTIHEEIRRLGEVAGIWKPDDAPSPFGTFGPSATVQWPTSCRGQHSEDTVKLKITQSDKRFRDQGLVSEPVLTTNTQYEDANNHFPSNNLCCSLNFHSHRNTHTPHAFSYLLNEPLAVSTVKTEQSSETDEDPKSSDSKNDKAFKLHSDEKKNFKSSLDSNSANKVTQADDDSPPSHFPPQLSPPATPSGYFSIRLIYRLLTALLQLDPDNRPALQDVLEILYSAEYFPDEEEEEEEEDETKFSASAIGQTSPSYLYFEEQCELNCPSSAPACVNHYEIQRQIDTHSCTQPALIPVQSPTQSPKVELENTDPSNCNITPVSCPKARIVANLPRGVVSPQLRAVARYIHELPHRQLKLIDRQGRK